MMRYYSLKKFLMDQQSNKIFVSPEKRREENYITAVTVQEFQKVLNASCGVLYEKWSKNMIAILRNLEEECQVKGPAKETDTRLF